MIHLKCQRWYRLLTMIYFARRIKDVLPTQNFCIVCVSLSVVLAVVFSLCVATLARFYLHVYSVFARVCQIIKTSLIFRSVLLVKVTCCFSIKRSLNNIGKYNVSPDIF